MGTEPPGTLLGFDPDPRRWPCDIPYAPIWLEPDAGLFAIVDNVDHSWACRHTWRVHWDKHGRLAYATRSTYLGGRKGRRVTLFLHKEVLLHAVGPPDRPGAALGDHRTGNSLDCRRGNLRWATHSENRRNTVYHRSLLQ